MGFVRSFLLAAIAALFCGCATERRPVDVSRLLRELDKPKASPAGAANAATSPDAPDKPAPPPTPGGGAAPTEKGGAAGGGATIQPDSTLEIAVAEDPSLNGAYQVNAIGAIQLGYVGPVIIFNKTEREAEQKIQDVLRYKDFRKATVRVRVIRASYDRLQVGGEVNRPGTITIGAGESVSLNDALLRVGGLKAVQNPTARIIRGGMLSVAPFTLPAETHPLIGRDGRLSIPNVFVHNNDILLVSGAVGDGGAVKTAAGGSVKTILVLGEVSRSGYYQFEPGEPCSMLHLMLKMGGLPPFANKKAVKVIRRDEQGYEEEITVNVGRLMEYGAPEDDLPLKNGDRVKVPAKRISLF